MKKIVVFLCSIFIIIIAVFFNWYVDISKKNRQVSSYNSQYEIYSKENISGVSITTIINKAIDNNEKYDIQKSDKDVYINDDKYSTKIYIKVVEDR